MQGLDRFRCDERGSVFILVGLAIVVLVGVVGVALDLGTKGMIKTRMQNAADAAALGGAVADGVSDAERAQIARRYFALNYPDNYLQTDLTASNVGITTSGDSVLVDTNLRERRADLIPVIGIDTIKTRAVSEVRNSGSASADIRDITLVMDASGSMTYPVDGPSGSGAIRIVAARTAARILVDEVLCKLPGRGSRIGWTQYSSACISETNCTDQTRFLALNGSCNQVNAQVNAYNPEPFTGAGEGWTNGGDGLERGEALMGAARPNVIRAVVYMTDGLNNTYGTNNYCFTAAQSATCQEMSGSPTADIPAREACTRMKARGILIYGISFSADAVNAQVVRDCASPGAGFYFYAPDEVALQQAFRDIVTSIKSIRITR